jgi:predicted GTPase
MTVSNVLQTLRRAEIALEAAEFTPSKANQLVHMAEAPAEVSRAFQLLNEAIRDVARTEEVSK